MKYFTDTRTTKLTNPNLFKLLSIALSLSVRSFVPCDLTRCYIACFYHDVTTTTIVLACIVKRVSGGFLAYNCLLLELKDSFMQ